MSVRRSARSAALAAALLSAGCARAPERPAEPDWREDPRLVELFHPCHRRGHFGADTSELLPVMVAKLVTGQIDVIRAFRAELAQLGDAAVPELEALVGRHYADPHGMPALRTALGVLRLSGSASAHGVLRVCLEHPNEEVRSAAAAGLANVAKPEDYDALASLMPASGREARAVLVGAMRAADPERLTAELASWMDEGIHRDLWLYAAKELADGAAVRAAPRLARHAAELSDVEVRPYLLASLAKAGDAEAFAELGRILSEGIPRARTVALEAIDATGRAELALAALSDEDPVLRVRAASIVKRIARERGVRDALAAALHDVDPAVRQVSLEALLSVGDREAADLAITRLRGPMPDLQMVLLAAREHWKADPELAQRALALLLERYEEEAQLPLDVRRQVLRAIGQIPLAAAGRFLVSVARSSEGELQRMSAHRWLVREAGNTAPGREVLREAWREEDDERRRMDLLEGACFGRDDPTRSFLLELVGSDHAGPWELLYAADRLVRLGPAQEIAPVLKRVALRQDHPAVRPALDCLLWRWYG